MKDFDIKLATIGVMSGHDPTCAYKGKNKKRGLDCEGLDCSTACPFFTGDLIICDAPKPGSKEYKRSKVRTYEDAKAVFAEHPEYLL